jgi:hypothetical protein
MPITQKPSPPSSYDWLKAWRLAETLSAPIQRRDPRFPVVLRLLAEMDGCYDATDILGFQKLGAQLRSVVA